MIVLEGTYDERLSDIRQKGGIQMIFDRTNHRKLWMWLKDHPEAKREEWHGWKTVEANSETLRYHCFACGVCYLCEDCPLEWPINVNGLHYCDQHDGLLINWEHSKDPEERSRLAQQIAELPVKPGITCV